MKKWLIFFLLLSLLAVPVSAATINTTLLYVDTFNTRDSGVTTGFTDTLEDNYIIVEEVVAIRDENAPVSFIFTYNNGTTVSGTIEHRIIDLFTGQTTVTFGGATATYDYFRGFSNLVNSYWKNMYFVYSVDDTNTYYISLVPRYRILDNTNVAYPNGALLALYYGGTFGSLAIDTTTDAFFTVTAPSNSPITSVSFASESSDIRVWSSSATIDSVRYAETRSYNNIQSGGSSIFASINNVANLIVSTAGALAALATGIAGFFGLVYNVVLFVFIGQVLFTLIAAYTIIAIVLSVHDSDNLFKSIGKFVRYEMKLLRFFMQLFLWVKNMIKWW